MSRGLPGVIVIGAMKCGTTAVHHYLDAHPDIAMARPKELNFFFDAGTWHRGLAWYTRQFDRAARVAGESSPGYTSPDHPEVAARMAALVPHARLIYLIRDPLERALSQYRHHRRDGAEARSVDAALLDPASQYVARSRYHERLLPFLDHFAPDRITVLDSADLLADRAAALARLYAFAGVDPGFWSVGLERRWHVGEARQQEVAATTRERFAAAVGDDVERLRRWLGRELAHWSV